MARHHAEPGEASDFSSYAAAVFSSAARAISDTIRTISAMRTSAPCAIPRKARLWWHAATLRYSGDQRGDGGHQHPTQTLTDLLTHPVFKGHLDHMTIGLRRLEVWAYRPLAYPCPGQISGNQVRAHFPEELRLPGYIRSDVLDQKQVEYEEVVRLDALPKLDLLYMTRVQKERFFNEEDYVRMKDFYIWMPRRWNLRQRHMCCILRGSMRSPSRLTRIQSGVF